MDIQAMMEQGIEAYRKSMEEALQGALEQQKHMNDEMGFETTEEDRQELINEYRQQMVQYEKIMRQQIEMQAPTVVGDMPNMVDMQSFQAQMAGMMAQYAEDDEEDDEIDEEALQAFLQANAVPAHYKKYMPIGALLIGTQEEPYETLRLLMDEDDTAYILENGWGIDSREEGLEMLASLLDGRHAKAFAEEFAHARIGNYSEMDEENADDYKTSVQAIIEVLELPVQLVSQCETLYAWDLERIGYLARLFVNIGYITEDEAWDWMKKAAVKVKETFSSWEEYIISVLLGRGFAMGVHLEPFAVALDLLTENRAFLDESPIAALA